MKSIKKTIVAKLALIMAITLAAGPAFAMIDKSDENPAKEGAKSALEMAGNAAQDTGEAVRQGAQKAGDETVKAGKKVGEATVKAGQKTVETGRKAYEAVTADKVQAGVTGGLVLGVPAAGAGYLIAMAAGATNPITAGLVAGALVGGVAGYKTAENYEKTHP